MKGAPTFTLTLEGLNALVAAHIAAILPPDKVEALAKDAVNNSVTLLTPEKAAEHLQCANVRQCRDFCREQQITIVHGSHKKWWVEKAEIDRWILAHRVVLPKGKGTKIAAAPDHQAAA